MSINRDEWLKALADAGVSSAENDQDAITINEYAEMFDVCRATAERHLEKLEEKGLARKTVKRVTNSYGRTNRCIAYRLVP